MSEHHQTPAPASEHNTGREQQRQLEAQRVQDLSAQVAAFEMALSAGDRGDTAQALVWGAAAQRVTPELTPKTIVAELSDYQEIFLKAQEKALESQDES